MTSIRRSLLNIKPPKSNQYELDADIARALVAQASLGRWSTSQGFLSRQWAGIQQNTFVISTLRSPEKANGIQKPYMHATRTWAHYGRFETNAYTMQTIKRKLQYSPPRSRKHSKQQRKNGHQDQYLFRETIPTIQNCPTSYIQQW